MDATGTAIDRDVLAALLERSRDPLAGAASDALAASADAVPLWASARTDLLATYGTRLARQEAGEGPATSRLAEYTQVLRHARLPEVVHEAGWAAGDTFFVALIAAGEVLAVTTVARAVWHLESRTVPLDGSDGFSQVETFGIGDGFDDATLVKNALEAAGLGSDTAGTSVAIDRPGRRLTVVVRHVTPPPSR